MKLSAQVIEQLRRLLRGWDIEFAWDEPHDSMTITAYRNFCGVPQKLFKWFPVDWYGETPSEFQVRRAMAECLRRGF